MKLNENIIFLIIFIVINAVSWIGAKIKQSKVKQAQRRPRPRQQHVPPPIPQHQDRVSKDLLSHILENAARENGAYASELDEASHELDEASHELDEEVYTPLDPPSIPQLTPEQRRAVKRFEALEKPLKSKRVNLVKNPRDLIVAKVILDPPLSMRNA